MMLFLIVTILVAIAGVILSVGIIVRGKFPDTHVGHNAEMKKRGITCIKNENAFCQGRTDSEDCRACRL